MRGRWHCYQDHDFQIGFLRRSWQASTWKWNRLPTTLSLSDKMTQSSCFIILLFPQTTPTPHNTWTSQLQLVNLAHSSLASFAHEPQGSQQELSDASHGLWRRENRGQPKSLSTQNAFQRRTVLSETSKPDSGSILGSQEKGGRRLQQVWGRLCWVWILALPLTGPLEALGLSLPN